VTPYRKTGFRIAAALALAYVAMAGRSQAEELSPVGLAPGSPYILVFVTNDTYTATSTAIGTYNAEVNTEANGIAALAALMTTWSAIGSTSSVNAIDNIGSNPGVPIYDLNGDLIAADDTLAGLFSGSLLNPINIDENGDTLNNFVWTGSLSDGTAWVGHALGPGGPDFGDSSSSGSHWITYATTTSGASESLYAISGVLTTAPVPEPSTLAMMALGGAILLLAGSRKKTHSPA